MTDMKGNPHYDLLRDQGMLPEHAIVHSNLTVAFELRTLTLALAQNTPGWLDEVRGRLGHPTEQAQ